jgi:hypothetical protein
MYPVGGVSGQAAATAVLALTAGNIIGRVSAHDEEIMSSDKATLSNREIGVILFAAFVSAATVVVGPELLAKHSQATKNAEFVAKSDQQVIEAERLARDWDGVSLLRCNNIKLSPNRPPSDELQLRELII